MNNPVGRSEDWTVKRLIAPIAGVLALLAVVLVSVTFYSARTMDQTAVERQKALIDNALSLRLAQSLSELRSVAWWDEAVVKSRADNFDPDWLDVEVGVFVTTSYRHDRIILIDENDKPVYGFSKDARMSVASNLDNTHTLIPLIRQIRGGPDISPRIADRTLKQETKEDSAITDRKYGRGAAAIMSVDGHPVLASVMEITPSIDMRLNRPRPRLLASITDLNGAVLTEIGKSILVPDLAVRPAGPGGAHFELKSDSRQLINILGWTPKNPGDELAKRIFPLIALVLLATAISLILLFQKLLMSTRNLTARSEEAQHLANHDVLTSLPNRRMLRAEYNRVAAEAGALGYGLAIACVDLDRFKDINDTLGHQAGDELIMAVAKRLSEIVGEGDVVARLGGDELAVIRLCNSAESSDSLSREISACFVRPFDIVGHQIEANASVGISKVAASLDFDEAMREADIALYEAKANGRGQVMLFAPEMAEKLKTRHLIEVDLRRALAADELELHYQPIVEAASGVISSVEALVRWTSPKYGSIRPDIFVGIAEEAGMMAELGRFVIRRAMRDCRRWPGIKTAINISPAQLRSASIISDLLEPAARYGVDPTQITIEITESVLMGNDDRTLQRLNVLKESGFSLSLDDFGTGYSSLSYLRDFPFDKLKIDRSFVVGMEGSERGLAIVKSMVNFGHILGREIIAEGIETEQEMQIMQAAGCTHLQGFLFSKALPAAHIEAMASTLGRLSARRDRGADEASSVGGIVLPLRKAGRGGRR